MIKKFITKIKNMFEKEIYHTTIFLPKTNEYINVFDYDNDFIITEELIETYVVKKGIDVTFCNNKYNGILTYFIYKRSIFKGKMTFLRKYFSNKEEYYAVAFIFNVPEFSRVTIPIKKEDICTRNIVKKMSKYLDEMNDVIKENKVHEYEHRLE